MAAESGSSSYTVNSESPPAGHTGDSRWKGFKGVIADFFGVGEIDEGTKERYRQRREKCYRTNLKDRGDDVDFGGRVGRRQVKYKKKDSFLKIVEKAVIKKEKGKLGLLTPDKKMRSYAPGDLLKWLEQTPKFDEVKNECFYDEVDVSGAPSLPKESQMDMAMSRQRDDKDDHEFDDLDVGPDIPLTAIRKPGKLVAVSDRPALRRIQPIIVTAEHELRPTKKERRPIYDQLYESAKDFFCCKICKKQTIEDADYKRPYFSYFITFVQVVIMITAVSLYGFAKPHYSVSEEEALVLKPSLSIELVRKSEFGNIWLGPKQADLIHLGAKYSPCMRKDPNLVAVLEKDRADERESGCCVRDDGSGCVQTLPSFCSSFISTFIKWNNTGSSKDFTTGAVCGQDPKYCKTPASIPPFEWNKQDITKWPLCTETSKPGNNGSSLVHQTDRHMSCDLLGRPCCHGIQGECMITTREHCDFLSGYYHDEAFLCSQVNCFEEVCGMIPFVYPDTPDQFTRIISSNLLHAGFVHLLISFLFQIIVMARIERVYGSLRIMFIYIGSGAIGTLASCVLLPYHVETGPAGAHFGILACLYVDLLYNILNNWQKGESYKNSGLKINLLIYSLVLLVLFVLGLLPWLDNWAHIFGFVSGALLSLVLIKEIQIEDKGLTRLRVIIVSFLLFVLMFLLLMIGFYVVPITEGSWVQYINCIPFDDTFCQNMDVSIKRGSSYTSYL